MPPRRPAWWVPLGLLIFGAVALHKLPEGFTVATIAGALPIATNHCGQYDAIQITSPAATGYHESSSR